MSDTIPDQSGPDPSDPADDTPPGALWARMKADPQYAPEHLALEAVRRLGPEAQRWAARLRAVGAPVLFDTDFPGMRRFYSADPLGNRLEFLQPMAER